MSTLLRRLLALEQLRAPAPPSTWLPRQAQRFLTDDEWAAVRAVAHAYADGQDTTADPRWPPWRRALERAAAGEEPPPRPRPGLSPTFLAFSAAHGGSGTRHVGSCTDPACAYCTPFLASHARQGVYVLPCTDPACRYCFPPGGEG